MKKEVGVNDDLSIAKHVTVMGGWFYENTVHDDENAPILLVPLDPDPVTDITHSSVSGQYFQMSRDGTTTGVTWTGVIGWTQGGFDPYYDICNTSLLHFPMPHRYFARAEFEIQVPTASSYFIECAGVMFNFRGFGSLDVIGAVVGIKKTASGDFIGIYYKDGSGNPATFQEVSDTITPDTWYRVYVEFLYDAWQGTITYTVYVNGSKKLSVTDSNLTSLSGNGSVTPSGTVGLVFCTNPSTTGTSNQVRFRYVCINRLHGEREVLVTRGLLSRPSKLEVIIADMTGTIPDRVAQGTFVRVYQNRSNPPDNTYTGGDPSWNFIPIFTGFVRIIEEVRDKNNVPVRGLYRIIAVGREAYIHERKITIDLTGGTLDALQAIQQFYYVFADANMKTTNKTVRGIKVDAKFKERPVAQVLGHLAAMDGALTYFDGMGEFYFGPMITADTGEKWDYSTMGFLSVNFTRNNPDYRSKIVIIGNGIKYEYYDTVGEGIPTREEVIKDDQITTLSQARQRALAEAAKRRDAPVSGEIKVILKKIAKRFDVGYVIYYSDFRYGWTDKPFIVHEFTIDLLRSVVTVKLGSIDLSPYKSFQDLKKGQQEVVGDLSPDTFTKYTSIELNANVGIQGFVNVPGFTSGDVKCLMSDEFLEWLAKHFSYYDANAAKKTWIKQSGDDKVKVVFHSDSTFFPKVTDKGSDYTDGTGFAQVPSPTITTGLTSTLQFTITQSVNAGTYYGVTVYWQNNPNVMGNGYTTGDPILAMSYKFSSPVTHGGGNVSVTVTVKVTPIPATYGSG